MDLGAPGQAERGACVPSGQSPTPMKHSTRGDVPALGRLTDDMNPDTPRTQSQHLLNTSRLKTHKRRKAAGKDLVQRAEHGGFRVPEPQTGSGKRGRKSWRVALRVCQQEGRGQLTGVRYAHRPNALRLVHSQGKTVPAPPPRTQM